MSAAASLAGQQGLWFLSRASGLTLLMACTAVLVLGIAARTGAAPGRLPRFVPAELHRNLALFSVAFLVLHVVTALLDPFVTIGWAATVLPFLSGYRPLAIGLGALAVDLGGAVLLTSLLRGRLGYRRWRAVHWLAYLAWPRGLRALSHRRRRPAHLVGRADRVGLRRGGGHRAAGPGLSRPGAPGQPRPGPSG